MSTPNSKTLTREQGLRRANEIMAAFGDGLKATSLSVGDPKLPGNVWFEFFLGRVRMRVRSSLNTVEYIRGGWPPIRQFGVDYVPLSVIDNKHLMGDFLEVHRKGLMFKTINVDESFQQIIGGIWNMGIGRELIESHSYFNMHQKLELKLAYEERLAILVEKQSSQTE